MMRHSAARTKGQGDTTNSSRSNSCTTNRIRGRSKGQGQPRKKAINCEVRGRGGGRPTEATPCRGKALSDVVWQVESTEEEKYSARMDFRLCVLRRRRGCCRVMRKGGKGMGVTGVAIQVRRFLISPISVDVFIKFPA